MNFALKYDQHRNLLFSPLQGEAAKSRLTQQDIQDLDSIALYDHGNIYRRSEAVLRTLAHMGGFWRVFLALRIFPLVVRDGVYRFIAKHRYQWFGKRDSCRFPTPQERKMFLD